MGKEKLFDEKNISQKPALELLQSLGYTYISPQDAKIKRGRLYNVLLKDILKAQLRELNSYEYKGQKYSFSEKNIDQAVADLDEPLTNGLVKTNENIYNSLMLGRSYQETLPDGSRKSYSIQYIDWETPENNVYHVTDEFSVEREDGQGNSRPDIVLFVNGIPLGVIECKRSSVNLSQGIGQTIGYQNKDAIPHLYKYAQVLMATNKDETMYGTCGTPRKFWTLWREEDEKWLQKMLYEHIKGRLPACQDKNIIALFSPKRLLDITKYFTVFENNVKIIARFQQYFAVQEIIKTINTYNDEGNRQGGVIWHTQGSGKSLTMVMLAKYLFAEIKKARVVVVTDRKNLDKQIRNTFAHTRLTPARATSGQMLVDLLNDDNKDIITTLVHKFDTASKKHTLIKDKDIFVLVDESHRTHYGELHIKMKQVLPDACYLGFTGTPLMKKEKNTMIKFGLPRPIHTYSIADGVRDKSILPLLYEGKMVEQTANRKAIDKKLEIITRHLNEAQKEEVKQKWSRFEKIASSNQRIELIAFDINDHFVKNYKTEESQFKAMLAVNTKKEAVKYLQAFEELGDLSVAVVISPPDQREGEDEVDGDKEEVRKYWDRMMAKYNNEENYEDSLKDDLVNGDLDMVIVVDKLLTGFDAPRATVMYIDKQMKEHTLLQAIARVNRLFDGKDYGYIIDYRGLLKKLDEAMNIYSGAGLENYDPEDLKRALYDVKSIIGALRQAYTQLVDIFLSIKNKNDIEEYAVRLANDEIREEFYEILSAFARNLAIALESEEIYNTIGSEELDKYKKELKFYQELRKSVKLRYSDGVDHKEYESKMQKIMDTYISSGDDIIRITMPVDVLDSKGFEDELLRLKTPRAQADAIRTRMAQSIESKWDENPIYYQNFSQKIEETLRLYEEARISERDYLNRMNEHRQKYKDGDAGLDYPDNVRRNKSAQAFYSVIITVIEKTADNINVDRVGDISLKIDDIILKNVKVDWYDNPDVHNRIEQEIDDLLFEFANQNGIKLSIEQMDEIIENIKTIALRRY